MKFRYRGGTKGYIARRAGRAVGNAYAGDDVGSCILIIVLGAFVVGGPLGILILIGLAMAILPAIALIGLAVGICAAVYYALKNKYPQKALSWFFLKVDEPDGTVLPLGELKSRMKESFSRDTTEAREALNMETSSDKKQKSRLSGFEIFLLIILSCLVCLFLGVLGMSFLGRMSSSSPQPQSNLAALPKHTVIDYQGNRIGTGFVYVIVADKSLTEEDAKKIISYYENQHPGYEIMNIWIFCDTTYASLKYVNDVQYSDSPYLSHVMYWLMATKLGESERWFHSGPDADFPAFRSACK